MAGQNVQANSAVLAGSAFALGLITGLLLKTVGKRGLERARANQWHRDYERTVTYDENLPETLERREPLPESRQPRFGSTGALGVHPAAAHIER